MLREINKTICSIWKLVSLLLKGNLEKETYFKSNVNKTDSVLLGLNLIAQSLDQLYIRLRSVDKISESSI